jgi:hypothetical protein
MQGINNETASPQSLMGEYNILRELYASQEEDQSEALEPLNCMLQYCELYLV